MPQWSHTRIETYRHCPRKFHFRYVARVRLPEEPEALALFLGARVHDALEWLYEVVRRGEQPDLAGLHATFRERWDAEWHGAILMPDERPPELHRAQAEGWLADYFRRHAPFTDSRTIDVERRIQFPLDPGGDHQMIGFIDRLSRTGDGTWQIHDYKTNRHLPTQQDKDGDPQLAYYEIGIRAMWPDDVRDVELVWHFIAFDTAVTSRRTPDQLAALRGAALATIGEIQSLGRAVDAFPTRESARCAYCEYEQACPARRHRFAVRALAPSRYAEEPGVKLVNAWVGLEARRKALKSEVDALEAEIDEVRAAIEAFADREGLEVVVGDEREATVKRGERVIFPRKSHAEESDEAAALEAQLRTSPHWPEVSDVDRPALARLWTRRAQLDADLRALLEEYARTEPQVDVRLRNRKD